MSSDIIANFGLDKNDDNTKIVVIKEVNGCDSSFISSCVLGHCIKNKSPLLMISLHNSLLHYHNVGLKMNYNLQKCIDSGLIDFYAAGEELINSILEDKNILSWNLWLKIKVKIDKLNEQHGSVNIIFEGLTHLFDMQFTLKEVNIICKNIIDVMRDKKNTILLFHCNVASDEDVTNVLANILTYKAQILTEVENLPSGLSTDVSGRLTFKYVGLKYQKEYFHTLHHKQSQYLFRLFDRGVKLLAPGTV